MADSAKRKVARAAKHICDINEIVRKRPPYAYVLRTDIRTGERSTLSTRDNAVIAEIVDIAADAIHNLRTALDHAYWEIVASFATSPREEKAVQFPFSETSEKLHAAARTRLAGRVSESFLSAILGLKPHGEAGGNELLYAIHYLDTLDKHRFPIPVSDYKTFTGRDLRKLVPDWPLSDDSKVSFGEINKADVIWRIHHVHQHSLGEIKPPTTHIFEKKLPIRVDMVFQIRPDQAKRPFIPTLKLMCDVALSTIDVLRRSH